MHRTMLPRTLTLAAVLAAHLAPPLAAQDRGGDQQSPQAQTTTIYSAARLILRAGDPVLTGDDARLAVRGGKVVAVGGEITPGMTQRARVSRFEGATIVPGFVAPHTDLGLGGDLAEPIDAFTPHLDAADAFNPFDDRLDELAKTGVTSAVLSPLSANTFGGRAALVRSGELAGQVVTRDCYLKMALVQESLDQQRYPTSRMGAADMIRSAFAEANSPLGVQTPEFAALRAVLDGSLGVAVHARTHAEITTTLDVLGPLGIDPVLLEAAEVDENLDRLTGTGVRVTLPGLRFDSPERLLELPAKLAEAKIPFAFMAPDGRWLRRSMALAVRHGLSRELALAAATSVPAEIAGADDHVGSLRVGRDADFAIFHGDPCDLTARLLAVRVAGRAVFDHADDETTDTGAAARGTEETR